MKSYPTLASPNVQNIAKWILGISKQRNDDIVEIANLKSKYLTGRVRTDREFPTANGDVNDTDKEGDIVRSATYEVILINDSGTLKWARSALTVTW